MSKLKVNAISDAAGANGNAITLATDGTCTAKVTNNLSNRNLIINGAMQIAQRGNVTGITASSYGGPDRFKYADNSDATVTINASTITNLSGFGKAYQLDITTADAVMASNHFAHIRQTLEGQDLQAIKKGFADAEPLTLSFWVYTNKTGDYTVHMYDSDNTRHCSQLYSVSSANTWEKKTLTFPADTTGKLTNDNNASLEIDWNLAAGTNYTSGTLATSWASYTAANASAGLNVNLLDNTSNEFYLTGVQLEVDSTGSGVATDFEHRSYADEFLRCARYCVNFPINAQLGLGQVYSGSGYIVLPVSVPVPMRTKPSVSKNGTYWFSSWSGNSGYSGDRTVTVERPSTGEFMYSLFVAGGSNQSNAVTVWCQVHDDAGEYMRLEAEL